MALVLLSLFPASLMILLGAMAAEDRKKTGMLFLLSAVWVAAGLGIQGKGGYGFSHALLCYAQAGAGILAWIGSIVRGMGAPKDPGPSTSDRRAPSPPASS